MVIGLFLRNFKSYKNIRFIPVTSGYQFSAYVGENGIGKTAILQALDLFFCPKGREHWITNIESRKQGAKAAAYVIPFFLIEKTKADIYLDDRQKEAIDIISDYFWNTPFAPSEEYKLFYQIRDELKKKYSQEDYYIVAIGKINNSDSDSSLPMTFGGYDNEILGNVEIVNLYNLQNVGKDQAEAILRVNLCFIFDLVESIYDYIYIPVETNISEYTRLDNFDLQVIIDKKIGDDVKRHIDFRQIDTNINQFVTDINSKLKGYIYSGRRKKITLEELADKIIEAYFSTKELNKIHNNSSNIPISNLSAGDKRKALIEIASTFLTQKDAKRKSFILGIDEPDASLHLSSAFNQFEKLEEMSQCGTQILITTHWYGFLPIISNGFMHSITKNQAGEVNISTLNLNVYRSQLKKERERTKGKLPYDVEIKSYTDLSHSIISSIRSSEPFNYLICEGLTEKIYFESFFSELVANRKLRILPVGGSPEVVKIFNNLSNYLSDKEIVSEIKGKILCLVDTDKEVIDVKNSGNEKLVIKRLLLDNDKITLETNSSKRFSPLTEIENCLQADIYVKTLEYFSKENTEVSPLIGQSKILTNKVYSGSALDLTSRETTIIKDFFDKREGENKTLFANKYIELCGTNSFVLPWVKEIYDYYK